VCGGLAALQRAAQHGVEEGAVWALLPILGDKGRADQVRFNLGQKTGNDKKSGSLTGD
jgi:hypothetical protein